jgi:hypothetical protein
MSQQVEESTNNEFCAKLETKMTSNAHNRLLNVRTYFKIEFIFH